VTTTEPDGIATEADDGWPLPGNPDVHVGTRHHVVPRFYLERFARADRIAVVDPRTGARRVASIRDTAAEKDYYTFVNTDGELDGRMEQLLGKIEGDAAEAIRNMTSIFGGDVSPDDRASVCLLLAFQLNRGRAARRRSELFGDLMTRLLLVGINDEQAARAYIERQGGTVNPETVAAVIDMSSRLDTYEFVPDPNDHTAMIGKVAEDAMPYLLGRRWFIYEWERPALLSGDEPVSLFSPGPHEEVESLGLATARQVLFPLDPRRLLVLGELERGTRPVARAEGTSTWAELANWLTTYNAYDSVFLHPDVSIEVPVMEAQPLFRVSTDASPVLDRYNRAPRVRRTQRRRQGDGKRRR
jgi:hypothetical protein